MFALSFDFLVLTFVSIKAGLKIYFNENNTNSIVDPENFIIVEFMLFGLWNNVPRPATTLEVKWTFTSSFYHLLNSVTKMLSRLKPCFWSSILPSHIQWSSLCFHQTQSKHIWCCRSTLVWLWCKGGKTGHCKL